MFKKKMTVAMANVVVTMAGSAANVSFLQRWESGKYKDEGAKHSCLRDRDEMVAKAVFAGSLFAVALPTPALGQPENGHASAAADKTCPRNLDEANGCIESCSLPQDSTEQPSDYFCPSCSRLAKPNITSKVRGVTNSMSAASYSATSRSS